jgi:hypothetical protein
LTVALTVKPSDAFYFSRTIICLHSRASATICFVAQLSKWCILFRRPYLGNLPSNPSVVALERPYDVHCRLSNPHTIGEVVLNHSITVADGKVAPIPVHSYRFGAFDFRDFFRDTEAETGGGESEGSNGRCTVRKDGNDMWYQWNVLEATSSQWDSKRFVFDFESLVGGNLWFERVGGSS